MNYLSISILICLILLYVEMLHVASEISTLSLNPNQVPLSKTDFAKKHSDTFIPHNT